MLQLVQLLFISISLTSFVLSYTFYKDKKYLTSLFCLSLSAKIALFFIMETGLKYTFVLDSLKYEMDAWNLMKAQVSNTSYILEAFEKAEYLNPFTTIMLNVFYVFGKIPQIVTLLNMFFSLGIYYFCIQICLLLQQTPLDIQKNKSILLLGAILFFYPSLNVWSVTNTKDPAALFFLVAGLFGLISIKQNFLKTHQLKFFLILIFSVTSLYISHLFRPYVLPILITGLVTGFLLKIFRNKFNPKTTVVFLISSLAVVLFFIEKTQPVFFEGLGQAIYKARAGFLNEDWADDISRSAFLVNYTFNTTLDYLAFAPLALAYYFFGPFIWDIGSMTEALGLFEVLFIILLMKSFFRGLKILAQRNTLEFNILICMFIELSLSQAFIISNMGTVFRHRTLSILIYLIISAVGFRFDKKELQNN